MYVILLIIYAFLQELTYDELLWQLKDKLFDFPAKGILLPPKPEPVKVEVEPELENPYEKVEEEEEEAEEINKKEDEEEKVKDQKIEVQVKKKVDQLTQIIKDNQLDYTDHMYIKEYANNKSLDPSLRITAVNNYLKKLKTKIRNNKIEMYMDEKI